MNTINKSFIANSIRKNKKTIKLVITPLFDLKIFEDTIADYFYGKDPNFNGKDLSQYKKRILENGKVELTGPGIYITCTQKEYDNTLQNLNKNNKFVNY